MAQAKPKTSLDLDALEREGDPGPFSVTLGGHIYEMIDPQSLDYRDLVDLMVAAGNGDIVVALGGMLPEDERDEFWENRIPAFKLNAMIEGYLAHYGIDLNAGEPRASSGTSRGTARRSKQTSRSRV